MFGAVLFLLVLRIGRVIVLWHFHDLLYIHCAMTKSLPVHHPCVSFCFFEISEGILIRITFDSLKKKSIKPLIIWTFFLCIQFLCRLAIFKISVFLLSLFCQVYSGHLLGNSCPLGKQFVLIVFCLFVIFIYFPFWF